MLRQDSTQKLYAFTITGESKIPVFHQTGFPSQFAAHYVGLTVVRSVYPGHRLVVTLETQPAI